ncbi:hypothetical protein MC65_005360 [Aeromonas caviae]|nr:hypothetical protein MC65_005360 [Aeromonas caviae]
MFCLATNQIAQTGLSSLPPVIYYSEQLFRNPRLPDYVCLCDESARAFSMFSNDSPRGCGEISILNNIG